jgi:hypothetical protein
LWFVLSGVQLVHRHAFCGECKDFPCEMLKTFQKERPHRIELWDSLKQIRERGWEAWFRDRTLHYACEQCGVLNSAYHPPLPELRRRALVRVCEGPR